jgi:hypothetical protein
MVKPYVMGLSYHRWLEMAVVLFFLAFPEMDVGNPLPASVLNASMKTMGCRCDACAKHYACSKEMLLPLVNSPRAGVRGSTGQDPAYNW